MAEGSSTSRRRAAPLSTLPLLEQPPLTNAQDALQLWAEDAIDRGVALPKPRSMEDVARELADGAALAILPLVMERGRPVKANLSLDAGLLAAIDEAAAARGVTRSAFLSSAARRKSARELASWRLSTLACLFNRCSGAHKKPSRRPQLSNRSWARRRWFI